MRPGPHAAADGSFARSAGMQTVRGAALLGVALLVGVLLLHTAPSEGPSAVSTTKPKPVRTTLPRPAATTPGGAVASPPPTTAALRTPSQIAVLVANGTKVVGAASRVKTQLLQAGYNAVGTDNATSNDNATTLIEFTPGFQPEAVALAASLTLPATAAQPIPSPPPVPDTKGANIVVVVGTDLASQLNSSGGPPATQPKAPPSTSPRTTTTVRHTTTTVARATTTTVKH